MLATCIARQASWAPASTSWARACASGPPSSSSSPWPSGRRSCPNHEDLLACHRTKTKPSSNLVLTCRGETSPALSPPLAFFPDCQVHLPRTVLRRKSTSSTFLGLFLEETSNRSAFLGVLFRKKVYQLHLLRIIRKWVNQLHLPRTVLGRKSTSSIFLNCFWKPHLPWTFLLRKSTSSTFLGLFGKLHLPRTVMGSPTFLGLSKRRTFTSSELASGVVTIYL